GNGDVQWCRGYDSAPHYWYSRSASRIVKAQDGNYVLLATLGYPEYNWFYRPFLMKTDLNGDTLWTRSMGVEGYGYETMDLLAYSDGGFMYNGLVWGELPEGQANFAFIHKTDPEGHLPCSERHQPVQVTALFPVDSTFTLVSVDGALEKPAFVQETVYPPITMYESCEVITAIQPLTSNGKRPMLRPNPNTGRFTVQFHDPLLAESYYSVFDALGKLLVQRRLPAGATLEEVDLSRFGRGTYVLKFTSPDGVCHERVVVE
ncbi:MAG TPA: T9SS type A sorting domain-containing protein, partial [Flavobacteriales bacterium]|nr:T9SS type A sorting domain-containing protein [Flavobacteriales bacterium]